MNLLDFINFIRKTVQCTKKQACIIMASIPEDYDGITFAGELYEMSINQDVLTLQNRLKKLAKYL